MKKDRLFSVAKDPLVKFTFDKHVADVFPDMIERSVPGYSTIVAMIGVLAAEYAQKNSTCYDLGCSLGAVTLAIRKHVKQENVKIIAVDNSDAMVLRSQKIILRDASPVPVEIRCEDIKDTIISDASVVVLNFTLQFLNPAMRDTMLQKIYDGMLKKGIVIISEKISFDDSAEQEKQTDWHLAFKKANGYSDLEIAQKRTALENVLIPETLQMHKSRILNCGFKSVNVWFQCYNFVSFLAIK